MERTDLIHGLIESCERLIDKTQNPENALDEITTTFKNAMRFSSGASSGVKVHYNTTLDFFSSLPRQKVLMDVLDYTEFAIQANHFASGLKLVREDFNLNNWRRDVFDLLRALVQLKKDANILELRKAYNRLLREPIAMSHGLFSRTEAQPLWTLGYAAEVIQFPKADHRKLAELTYRYGFQSYSIFLSFGMGEYLAYLRNTK